VSDGSDSEDTDTDEREAAKQKALGLQVRDVQGEQPHALPSPGNAVGVTSTMILRCWLHAHLLSADRATVCSCC